MGNKHAGKRRPKYVLTSTEWKAIWDYAEPIKSRSTLQGCIGRVLRSTKMKSGAREVLAKAYVGQYKGSYPVPRHEVEKLILALQYDEDVELELEPALLKEIGKRQVEAKKKKETGNNNNNNNHDYDGSAESGGSSYTLTESSSFDETGGNARRNSVRVRRRKRRGSSLVGATSEAQLDAKITREVARLQYELGFGAGSSVTASSSPVAPPSDLHKQAQGLTVSRLTAVENGAAVNNNNDDDDGIISTSEVGSIDPGESENAISLRDLMLCMPLNIMLANSNMVTLKEVRPWCTVLQVQELLRARLDELFDDPDQVEILCWKGRELPLDETLREAKVPHGATLAVKRVPCGTITLVHDDHGEFSFPAPLRLPVQELLDRASTKWRVPSERFQLVYKGQNVLASDTLVSYGAKETDSLTLGVIDVDASAGVAHQGAPVVIVPPPQVPLASASPSFVVSFPEEPAVSLIQEQPIVRLSAANSSTTIVGRELIEGRKLTFVPNKPLPLGSLVSLTVRIEGDAIHSLCDYEVLPAYPMALRIFVLQENGELSAARKESLFRADVDGLSELQEKVPANYVLYVTRVVGKKLVERRLQDARDFFALQQGDVVVAFPQPLAASSAARRFGGARSECCICMDSVVETALYPCSHAITCQECSNDVQICPICRCPIEQRLALNIVLRKK